MPEKLDQLTDKELVSAYQETASKAYVGELYRRYAHLVYGVGLKFLKNKEAAEDIVPRVFEQLMTSLQTAKVENFNNWLFIVSKNMCLKTWQKEQQRSQKQEIWEISEKKSDIFMENEAIQDLNSEKEQEWVMMNQLMQQLEEEQRKCLKLFYWEKKRYKEIVQLTNYTEKQVKSFLQNGKRNLKKLLLEAGYPSK
ncbi:MAG: RNA polymerase sigma factor [Saprospiraceae bacterium]